MAKADESESMQILRMGVRSMTESLEHLLSCCERLSLGQLEKLMPDYIPEPMWMEEHENAPDLLIKTAILNAFYDNIRDMTKEEAVDEMAHLVIDLLRVVRS